MRASRLAGAILTAVTIAGSPAFAEGNLAARGTDLPELKIDTAALQFSQSEYELETGKYYRLTISSDGGDEIEFAAPEMWHNCWIEHVSIDDVSVELGGLENIGFDDEGSAEIAFVPVRPGEYEFYAPGYEKRGLLGKFVVK